MQYENTEGRIYQLATEGENLLLQIINDVHALFRMVALGIKPESSFNMGKALATPSLNPALTPSLNTPNISLSTTSTHPFSSVIPNESITDSHYSLTKKFRDRHKIYYSNMEQLQRVIENLITEIVC